MRTLIKSFESLERVVDMHWSINNDKRIYKGEHTDVRGRVIITVL